MARRGRPRTRRQKVALLVGAWVLAFLALTAWFATRAPASSAVLDGVMVTSAVSLMVWAAGRSTRRKR